MMCERKGDEQKQDNNLRFTDEVHIMLQMINEALLVKYEKKDSKHNQTELIRRDNEVARIILSLVLHNIRKVF